MTSSRLRRIVLALVPLIVTVTTSQKSAAWVIMQTLRKGEVSSMVTGASRECLLKVPPLGGTETSGSWNHATHYYRGTQESLQELIDGLDAIEQNRVVIKIDSSGKLGRVTPGKIHKFPRPLIYQFSVSTSALLHQDVNRDVIMHFIVRVHSGGGIDPSKLRLPEPKEALEPPVYQATVARSGKLYELPVIPQFTLQKFVDPVSP